MPASTSSSSPIETSRCSLNIRPSWVASPASRRLVRPRPVSSSTRRSMYLTSTRVSSGLNVTRSLRRSSFLNRLRLSSSVSLMTFVADSAFTSSSFDLVRLFSASKSENTGLGGTVGGGGVRAWVGVGAGAVTAGPAIDLTAEELELPSVPVDKPTVGMLCRRVRGHIPRCRRHPRRWRRLRPGASAHAGEGARGPLEAMCRFRLGARSARGTPRRRSSRQRGRTGGLRRRRRGSARHGRSSAGSRPGGWHLPLLRLRLADVALVGPLEALGRRRRRSAASLLGSAAVGLGFWRRLCARRAYSFDLVDQLPRSLVSPLAQANGNLAELELFQGRRRRVDSRDQLQMR